MSPDCKESRLEELRKHIEEIEEEESNESTSKRFVSTKKNNSNEEGSVWARV